MAANGNPLELRNPCNGPTDPLLMQFLDFGNLQLPAGHDFPQREIAFLALELFVILLDLAAAFRARDLSASPKSPGTVSLSCRFALANDVPRHLGDFLHELLALQLAARHLLQLESPIRPVNSGEHNSGMSSPRNRVISENALAVGCNSRPLRLTYFS